MNKHQRKAQESLHIQSVNLRESRVSVRDDIYVDVLERDETIPQSFKSFIKIRETVLEDKEGSECWDYRFVYSVGIRLISKDEEDQSSEDSYNPLVEIVGVFEARYISFDHLDEDVLLAFSVDNVGYHVWPYWRELVQSSCARINLHPSIEVATYRINKKAGEEEETD